VLGGYESKNDIITNFSIELNDTGSPEVQVAILSWRIEGLMKHFESHPGDKHSRRGLFGLISKRRSLLDYLRRKNFDRYSVLIGRLGLRR